MKLANLLVAIMILLSSDAQIAEANAGIPMLAFALPGMVISLLPIILIETIYVRKSLGLTYPRALKVMTAGNLASTLIGIPLAWAAWFVIQATLGLAGLYIGDTLNLSAPPSISLLCDLLFSSAWLGPGVSQPHWFIEGDLIILLVPFFYASWLLERWIARKVLKEAPARKISKAIFTANLLSYGLLAAILLGLLIYSTGNPRAT